MRYMYRFGFNKTDRKTMNFLLKNNIDIEDDGSSYIVSFKIYEDEKNFQEISKCMEKYNVPPMITTEFTDEEMYHADWFYVRSIWLNGYPQPKDLYERIIYEVDKSKCMCTKEQIQNFRISKEVKWGSNRNFFSLNWVYDELFINASIDTLLIDSNLKGFHFRDVIIDKQNRISDTCKQLVIEDKLLFELNTETTKIKQKYCCSLCHENKVILMGKEHHYCKEAFSNLNIDIVKSKTVFGMENISNRAIYISRRFYRFLIDNKLDKNLIFEPIFLD